MSDDATDRRIQPDGKLVLFAGGGLLVADKPAGLPSTGRTLDDPDCLQSLLMQRLGRRKLWAVHQLDAGTTGLNLFSLRKPLVARFGEALAEGQKTYVALCHGRVEGAPRDIELPLGRSVQPDGRSVPAVREDGKPSLTTITPIAATDEASLVLARIHTGRTHQVRLHLAAIGHPLFGERMHRDPPCERFPRHALHSWRISLAARHGHIESFEARFPDDLRELASSLGLGDALDALAVTPLPSTEPGGA
ncbi:MAG: RNA pseudouridine synthase [Deltaproteobacteria bacterium]|nr:RNA pseudouridine synthase [Deltaproteobacteria bacterium]MCB9787834.1 RNA pseudouridine synthase [Deltaproteobacteria bacterium]